MTASKTIKAIKNETEKFADPSTVIYYRLIALWVICEGMIGGLIHGLRIPVSGLVVGSAAVICISLIAWYHPAKGSILRATIIVAIFKFILSPQAGPPAYIAVLFQGLMGQVLFRGRKHFFISAMLLALLALMESGLQRILVLTIIYGNDLWSAINDLLNRLTGQSKFTNYSSWIAGTYLGIHFITGIFVGWFAGRLPGSLQKNLADPRFDLDRQKTGREISPGRKRKKHLLIGMLWILLFLLFLQSELRVGEPLLPGNRTLAILIRSLLIILGWVYFLGPLLRGILQKWLGKKRTALRQEVNAIERTLPEIKDIFFSSWKKYGGKTSFSRLPLFIKAVLVNVIRARPKLLILSGPVHSGKTSYLQSWIKDHMASGILSPEINGERVFQDISSGKNFKMSITKAGEPCLEIGRYRFSVKGFQKAERSIIEGFESDGWLIIDEIGPLELRGAGFASVLKRALALPSKNILIVVREGLVEDIVREFKIVNYEIIIPPPFESVTQPAQKH